MRHDHIEFHNTAELEESRSFGGVKLYRFPREVRHALGDRGRFISEEATGCELRFVTEAAHVRLTLLLPDRAGEVYVYRGGLLHSTHAMPAGIPKTLHLERPVRLAGMDLEKLTACGFAPEVWRVVFGRSEGVFLEWNTFGEAVRPPQAGETPGVRLLAYGSSITHGLGTYPLTYIDQAARRLKADLFNKGMSGSCLCEPEMADYLSRSEGWDAALLELGVNMRDHFPPDVFAERTDYLLRRMLERHPDKPFFLVTVYPNFATWADSEAGRREREYNRILAGHVSRMASPNLHLIPGDEILQDLSGLSCDMIHPGPYGHMQMGEQLAIRMQPVWEERFA
ncbi:SGNH/GDSL hydrolase family protein [Paenibacillus aurantius]|uniref:SGNH/GDSL hydrolase family protein n=1 Tax=Paenibacillus aurantius TaxID=2918900 RepID=A0AA96REU0_9BACL|nr:SGNH/GDSL hydrolase family protein [Paenibacillus aurantius]WNQ10751.1 SGNH/GDSL hydrolase family protein [Paenibacillus aurantius]